MRLAGAGQLLRRSLRLSERKVRTPSAAWADKMVQVNGLPRQHLSQEVVAGEVRTEMLETERF